MDFATTSGVVQVCPLGAPMLMRISFMLREYMCITSCFDTYSSVFLIVQCAVESGGQFTYICTNLSTLYAFTHIHSHLAIGSSLVRMLLLLSTPPPPPLPCLAAIILLPIPKFCLTRYNPCAPTVLQTSSRYQHRQDLLLLYSSIGTCTCIDL